MQYKSHKNILFVLIMIYFTGALPIVSEDYFLLVSTIYAFVLFFIRKGKIEIKYFSIPILMLLINFVMFVFGDDISLFKVAIGSLLRFFLAFFTISILKEQFIHKYLFFVYAMSVLSLCLYFVQLFYPQLFTSHLYFLVKFFTTEQRIKSEKLGFLIFNYHVNAPYRNSGFMWEPGGLGLATTIALYFICVIKRFNVLSNKITIVLIVTALSTFSVTTYILISILFFYVMLNNVKFKKSNMNLLISFLVSFCVIYVYNNNEMIVDKIDDYKRQLVYYTLIGNVEDIRIEAKGYGRVVSLIADVTTFVKYPFGQGDSNYFKTKNYFGEYITGANGLGPFIVSWGIFGIILLVMSLRKLEVKLKHVYPYTGDYLYFIILMILLFSNPISRNPFFMILLLFPFVVSNSAFYNLDRQAF